MRPSLATDRISLDFWLDISFCRKLSMSISIDSRYCNRFINLGRPIFPLNHSDASAATVFTITTTFGIAHARCYNRAERAAQSATRVGSSLLDSLNVPSTHYIANIVLTFSPILRDCTNSIAISRAPAIRHFFWWRQAAEPASWLHNDLGIPCAPETMSHKTIITINFHVWT